MKNKLRVLLVSSEVAPFSKTGGLADVCGSLPSALKHLGCDIRIATPLYKMVRESGCTLTKMRQKIPIKMGEKLIKGNVALSSLNGALDTYLIEQDEYYQRDFLYGTPTGDYPDNAERFTFFARMVLTLCKEIGFHPDVIHCNDWQSGLIPAYLRTLYRNDSFFSHTAVIFTIHNLAYQGNFPPETLTLTGLPPETFTPEGVEFWGKLSFLKAGIVYSEIINTVSRGYSCEIQTKEFGCGMEGVLAHRKNDLFGVINGVDYNTWNPEKDPLIAAPYRAEDLSGKARCKEDLLTHFGLSHTLKNLPLLGMISRLADQKGFDLVAEIMEALVGLKVGFVLLGTGEQKYHTLFEHIAKKYPKRVGIRLGFDNTLAHKIEAGCDMFLMPSRYEPCGLNQIYSLKYGTIPVVRATGGLDDTITHYNPRTGEGNGFKFTNYSAAEFLNTITQAIKIFENREAWIRLVKKGMAQDFSWQTSAAHYLELYQKALAKKGYT